MQLAAYLIVSGALACLGGFAIYGSSEMILSPLLVAWIPTSIWAAIRSRKQINIVGMYGPPFAVMLSVIALMGRGHLS